MKTTKYLNVIFINLMLLTASTNTFANVNWQCNVEDLNNQTWTGSGKYQKQAINLAFDACKKSSQQPASCRASKESCDEQVNGRSTKPQWQCSALDQMAGLWTSNPYTHRDDAALAAKAYCQNNSGYSDTCYVNLLTCKNINRMEE